MNEINIVNGMCIVFIMLKIFLQAKNFFTYRLKNGANQQRMIMFACSCILFVHAVRNYYNHPMYFLLVYSLISLQLFDGYRFFWNLITKPVR